MNKRGQLLIFERTVTECQVGTVTVALTIGPFCRGDHVVARVVFGLSCDGGDGVGVVEGS